MATTLAAAVLLSLPAALAAQRTSVEARRQLIVSERIHRTWTIDSVLVALAADSAPWEGVSRPRFETRQAADAAHAILRGSGGRVWKQVEGIASPLSQAERDAFAERLVAIAIANPESEGAQEIVMTMLHLDDFDAVLRMYEAGAGDLWHLLRIDPRRGIEVGMEKLRANRWRDRSEERARDAARRGLGDAFRPKVPGFYEMCRFIGSLSPPFGTLAVVNGRPVFTFHEGVDLSRGSDGRKPTREEYAALDDATNELYEAGVIDTPCPYPGMGGMGHYSKHDPPTRARGR